MSEISLLGMASLLLNVKAHLEEGHKEALEKAGELCVEHAKAAIGTYEYGWPPLAESTMKHKSADTPLLESGAFRESIGYTISAPNVCDVGTNDPKAEWFEFGTSKMPPRSVIAETGRRCEAEVVAIVGGSIGKLLVKD